MIERELPQLVFATRSAEPKTGSDFVRQVVAERGGVAEEVRREFSRRADIAGSVLQFRPSDSDRLRVFFFHPLSEGTWLFARAVSLGLYRKGSHQLLVHGVVLDEETLDGLEANPLALDMLSLETGAGVGFRFLERHPGDAGLAPLVVGSDLCERVRRHNRERLAATSTDEDRWIASAYDALASGERTACVSADPRPEALERLLLHFHPDDRLEIGFSTFYSHSRRVDYRLITVLPEDLTVAKSHFRGIHDVDLGRAEPAEQGLGDLACKLRRSSLADFQYAVNQALLTHLSHRRRQPLSLADAALVLGASLYQKPLSSADKERLEILFQRAGGGLAYLVAHLAARWSKDMKELRQALDASARADEKITRQQVERYREERLDAADPAQRWALAALLTRADAFDGDAVTNAEALALWRRLLPERLLNELAPAQAEMADEILHHWALVDAQAGDPASDPPDWAVVLRRLGERRRPTAALAAEVEAALAGHRQADTPLTWRRLGDVLRVLGHADDARRVLLGREIPRLSAFEARLAVEPEVDRIVAAGGGALTDLAPHLGRPGVAAALFGRLADHVHHKPASVPWDELRRCLDRAESLATPASDAQTVETAGRLLTAILSSPPAGDDDGPWLVDRCRRLLPSGAAADAFASGVLKNAAADLEPVCETAGRSADLGPLVTAVAVLLEIRGRHPAASDADAELMRLAVRGRVLAAEAGEEAAVSRLDAIWKPFLSYASPGPAFDHPPPGDALEWLDLLQDEIYENPPETPAEDVALARFFDLAWSLWGESSESSAFRDSLAFKLRWALRLAAAERQTWFPMRIAEKLRPRSVREQAEQHRQRIRRRVPRQLWDEAEKLLQPPLLTSSPGEPR